MKKILIATLMMAIGTVAYAADACQSNSALITKMDIGTQKSASFRFCNPTPTANIYENSLVTSDGGIENQREMKGFLVDELIELEGCGCQEITIQRDPDEQLENEAGFFWLKLTEITPTSKATDQLGNVINIRISVMPVFTYGNVGGEVSKLSASVTGKKLVVTNTGARPGRIVAILQDGKRIDIDKTFILPGAQVDIAPKIPRSATSVAGGLKNIRLIDWADQEIPMI